MSDEWTNTKVSVPMVASEELIRESEVYGRMWDDMMDDLRHSLAGSPRLGPPSPRAVWEVPADPPEGLHPEALPLWRALADIAGGTVVEADPFDNEDEAAAEAAAAIGSPSWRPGNWRRP